MKKSVIIRKISLNDAGAIQKISNAISKNSSEINFEKLIQYKIANNEHETSLVAEIDNKVAGYMISNLLYAGFGLKKSAWIVTMGVKPDFMGQGLGVKLAKEIFQIYKKKNIEHIYSSVMWDSIDLLSFFKKLGFERSNFINLCKKL
ncbi:MAG: GNAT family N-acetyltransferase [Desulfobacteraceae bacterium 4572_130]|nr:MAG: GNAT family N-acetyltransferase [Desulfobacteraceae bacterium 4572_130]